MAYPPKLQAIIELFQSLPDVGKRENLVLFSEGTKSLEPKAGEIFDLEDVRKDEECTDTVGVFLKVDGDRGVQFRMTLGSEVQTLTRAMSSILCKGLQGATPEEVLDLESDFVPLIVGAELVRQRSQTTYYVLTRMKSACKVYLNRKRSETGAG
jgi:cysteine desulfuration protein SufE